MLSSFIFFKTSMAVSNPIFMQVSADMASWSMHWVHTTHGIESHYLIAMTHV